MNGGGMLSEDLINYLRDNGWWFEEVSIPYKEALESIGLSADSQIGFFTYTRKMALISLAKKE